MVEATLTIAGVKKHAVVDDQGIGRYTLNEVERISDGVRLSFNEALHIDLQLAGGVLAIYDEQPLPELCAIYRQYFLIQSGPKIERVAETDAG